MRKEGNKVSNHNFEGRSIVRHKWIGIIILISIAIALYSYCWIPAIPFLIYCLSSKKLRQYRITNSIICGLVIVTSLLVYVWLNGPKTLDSISVDWGKEEFSVGETTEVKITPSPSDAKIKTLELSKNSIADLDYSDGKAVITFKQAGNAALFFRANGNVQSYTKNITIIDKAAEEAKQRAEEERINAEQKALDAEH
ncbi:hypothetical protein [Clostridium sp. D5]|uniref:hypothetical protein n=1 Tax=Clostridium sp. D5 TaxID=556261 RepID=UPI00031F7C7D|nr:hypothetical protein [Clostridium sp. D5]